RGVSCWARSAADPYSASRTSVRSGIGARRAAGELGGERGGEVRRRHQRGASGVSVDEAAEDAVQQVGAAEAVVLQERDHLVVEGGGQVVLGGDRLAVAQQV